VGGVSVVAGHLVGEVLVVDRFPGGGEPLFPFVGGLWFVVGVKQEVSAGWTSAVLGLEKPQAAFVQRWRGLLAPSVGPVAGQGGVARR
jgi:hypothetical protein